LVPWAGLVGPAAGTRRSAPAPKTLAHGRSGDEQAVDGRPGRVGNGQGRDVGNERGGPPVCCKKRTGAELAVLVIV